MLKGLGSPIFRTLAAFLLMALILAPGDTGAVTISTGGGGSGPGGPQTITELYVQSDPGDFVGAGQVTRIDVPIFLSMLGTTATDIRITVTDGTVPPWELEFIAPRGTTFQVGQTYTNVQGVTSQATGVALLDVEGNSHGCDTITGEFTIRDLGLNPDGSVSSFAADFVQHCEGVNPALFGLIRINSSVPLDGAYANAGTTQQTFAGLPVTLDGSASRTGPDGTTIYNWTQIVAPGDPVVSLSGVSDYKASFIAPDVPSGGHALIFRLTASDGTAPSSSDTVKVVVGNEDDAKTAYYFESDPFDTAGQGLDGLITPPQYGFVTQELFGTLTAGMIDSSVVTPLPSWGLTFVEHAFPPDGALATTGGFVSPPLGGAPSLSAGVFGFGCRITHGQFIVRDLKYSADFSTVTSLAVDFVQRCYTSSAKLRGAYRYNSTLPVLINGPTALAQDQQVTTAGTVTLDGSNSFPGWGDITGYHWQQVGGPKVSLSNPSSSLVSFSVPANILGNGGNVLTFQFTVKNSLGLSDNAVATVKAAYPHTNLLQLQSDWGDPVGQGQSVSYTPMDAMIRTTLHGINGVGATLNGDGNWTLDFSAPSKQKLHIGTYSNAGRYLLGVKTGSSTLFVGTKPGQCKTVAGDFTVLDVAYNFNNTISTLAVDFDQHCNGIGPALHGKLRYHSSLP